MSEISVISPPVISASACDDLRGHPGRQCAALRGQRGGGWQGHSTYRSTVEARDTLKYGLEGLGGLDIFKNSVTC